MCTQKRNTKYSAGPPTQSCDDPHEWIGDWRSDLFSIGKQPFRRFFWSGSNLSGVSKPSSFENSWYKWINKLVFRFVVKAIFQWDGTTCVERNATPKRNRWFKERRMTFSTARQVRVQLYWNHIGSANELSERIEIVCFELRDQISHTNSITKRDQMNWTTLSTFSSFVNIRLTNVFKTVCLTSCRHHFQIPRNQSQESAQPDTLPTMTKNKLLLRTSRRSAGTHGSKSAVSSFCLFADDANRILQIARTDLFQMSWEFSQLALDFC